MKDYYITKKSAMQKQVMTIEEVAAYTGYSKAYIYKLSSQSLIPHYHTPSGRRLFFLLEEIIEWCTTIKAKTVNETLNKNL